MRDRASLMTQVIRSKRRLKASDALKALRGLEAKDRLPLVIASDNGAQFCANDIAEYCRQKKVIHLKSLPRTPQHNGACEIAVREVKDGLTQGFSVDETCLILNERRKRRRLGYKTATQFDREHFVPYTREARAVLYEAVRSAIDRSLLGTERALEKRKIERAVIFETLEKFKLIEITRGCQKTSTKPEDNA